MKKCHLISSLLLVLSLPLSTLAKGGAGDAGGGNAIICRDGKLYAFDYIQTVDGTNSIDPAFQTATDENVILRKIQKRLLRLDGVLAQSLGAFIERNEDPLRPELESVWIAGNNPLPALNDEEIRRIPVSCTGTLRLSDMKKRLRQAVVRTKKEESSIIFYEYDNSVMNDLRKNHPLQVSFLLLHEWLRDFTTSPSSLMRAVSFMHKASLESTTPNTFHRVMSEVGLALPSILEGPYTGSENRMGVEVVDLKFEHSKNGSLEMRGEIPKSDLSASSDGSTFFFQISGKNAEFIPTQTISKNGRMWGQYVAKVPAVITRETFEGCDCDDKSKNKTEVLSKESVTIEITLLGALTNQDAEYGGAVMLTFSISDKEIDERGNLKDAPGAKLEFPDYLSLGMAIRKKDVKD